MAGDLMRRRPGSTWRPDLAEWFEGFPFAPHFLSEQNLIRIEESEREGMYEVRAELPGIDPEKDVEITVQDRMLTIRAERSEERKDKHRSEFHYGTFLRSVRLPAAAKEEEVSARYAKGVLTVRVPLDAGRTTARQIEVQRED